MDRVKYLSGEIVRGVAVCQPAVRTVLVWAFCWDEDEGEKSDHEIVPVLALMVKEVASYAKEVRTGCYETAPATNALMVKRGWYFQGYETRIEPLSAMDGDVDTVEYHKADLCTGTVVETVACPWDQSEDEIRLAAVIAKLKEKAKQRHDEACKERKARESKAAPA